MTQIGVRILLSDMGQQSNIDLVSFEHEGQPDLRRESLLTAATLMQSDAGVCIQLLKLNLISNLILSVLQESS